jgi:hypothetical protein
MPRGSGHRDPGASLVAQAHGAARSVCVLTGGLRLKPCESNLGSPCAVVSHPNRYRDVTMPRAWLVPGHRVEALALVGASVVVVEVAAA